MNEVRRCESLERILRKPIFCLLFKCEWWGGKWSAGLDYNKYVPICLETKWGNEGWDPDAVACPWGNSGS